MSRSLHMHSGLPVPKRKLLHRGRNVSRPLTAGAFAGAQVASTTVSMMDTHGLELHVEDGGYTVKSKSQELLDRAILVLDTCVQQEVSPRARTRNCCTCSLPPSLHAPTACVVGLGLL